MHWHPYFTFTSGSETPTPTPTPTPAGVPPHGRVRDIIRLSDIDIADRQSTADWIKEKLAQNRQFGYQTPKVAPKPSFKAKDAGPTADDKFALEAMRNMEIERAEEQRIINEQNMIIALILAANSW